MQAHWRNRRRLPPSILVYFGGIQAENDELIVTQKVIDFPSIKATWTSNGRQFDVISMSYFPHFFESFLRHISAIFWAILAGYLCSFFLVISFGSFLGLFGVIFTSFLGLFGVISTSFLASFWRLFEVILASFWGHIGVIYTSFLGLFDVISTSFWGHIGVIFGDILRSYWRHFRVILESFSYHLYVIWASFRDRLMTVWPSDGVLQVIHCFVLRFDTVGFCFGYSCLIPWYTHTHTHTHTHTLTDPTEIVDGTKNSKKKKKKEKTKTTIRGLSAPGRPLRSLWPTGRRWRTGTTVFWRAGSWSCCRIWRHLAGAIRTEMSPERHQRRPASYLRVYCSLQTISPSCLHKWVSIRSLGRISMCFLSFL